MNGLRQQLVSSLRLYFRNTMALIYGYLFPTIFLIAFYVLYRFDQVPLVRHLGELLTVTVLGGACFGLPTAMVSERERGVWRRYRLLPVPTGGLVVSTVAGRYVLLMSAGLLQLALAMALGMPLPRHPLQLWIAFTCVSFAFLGLGLVIAMLADNVPAVQALGQCIFLPMLIIGGVAVQLASLPAWAQHLSAFFPGRYAVQAIQACVSGTGLRAASFDLLALLLIGAAGCLSGARMFRWDAQQRFMARGGKIWIAVALFAWIAVGALAEARGVATLDGARLRTQVNAAPAQTQTMAPRVTPSSSGQLPTTEPAPDQSRPPVSRVARDDHAGERAPSASPATTAPAPPRPARPGPDARESGRAAPASRSNGVGSNPSGRGAAPSTTTAAGPAGQASPPTPPAAAAPGATGVLSEPSSWEGVTPPLIEQELVFNHLPPDSGVVTPIARDDEQPESDVAADLDMIAARLPSWEPGKVADPVQRVRNYLYVAAVPDVFQMPSERFIPTVVFDRLEEVFPKDQLIKLLYWVAKHPFDGDDSAAADLQALGLGSGQADMQEVRGRVGVYAVKLLGRLTGHLP